MSRCGAGTTDAVAAVELRGRPRAPEKPETEAATCLSCSDEFNADTPQPVCPQCGSLMVQLDPDASKVQLTDVGSDDGSEE